MTINNKKLSNNNLLIQVSGRLDQSQTPSLESNLNDAVAQSPKFLFVDLTEATYINSGGLRCLVTAWRVLRTQDGELVLTGLNEKLAEIFSMVGFDKVFTIYPTVADGLQIIQDQPDN